jgi:hypothetical protein
MADSSVLIAFEWNFFCACFHSRKSFPPNIVVGGGYQIFRARERRRKANHSELARDKKRARFISMLIIGRKFPRNKKNPHQKRALNNFPRLIFR